MAPAITARPSGIVRMHVVGIESWGKQRMTLRDASVEDAHGDVLPFGPGEPTNEFRCPRGLFDV